MENAIQFTHVINPFAAAPGSEHDRAQRVTFASLRRAVAEAAAVGLGVEVLAVTLPEDAQCVEAPVKCLPVLRRTVLDFGSFQRPRKLPLLADLLSEGAREGQGEYVIYTNIDISLQPHFYESVSRLIAGRVDFCGAINRRSISKKYEGPEELEAMYRDDGEEHPGYDCFVFPRRWVNQLRLGNVCIGTRHFDGLLVANLDFQSGYGFEIYRNLRLTFHIGNDATWLSQQDYDEFNLQETIRQLRLLRRDSGAPQHHLRFLADGYEREARADRWLIRRLKRVSMLQSVKQCVRRWLIQISKPQVATSP